MDDKKLEWTYTEAGRVTLEEAGQVRANMTYDKAEDEPTPVIVQAPTTPQSR